jgi:glutaredoxin 3
MNIKVYTTPTCPWCKKLKSWLKKKKIDFEELDTTEEDKYRDELIEKSHQLAVPVLDIEGTIIIGFDEKKISAEIKKNK